MEELVKRIKEKNCVDLEIKNQYFYGKDYLYIRNWLKKHDLDMHMPIEMRSAGIIIVIEYEDKKKVLLQIRGTEKSRIGIFGGGIEDNEMAKDAAIRELKEELGLNIGAEQLTFLGTNKHSLVYMGGDKVNYNAEVFMLKLKEFPFIKLDYESNGVICLDKSSIKVYIDLPDEKSLQIYDYWLEFIYRALE